MPAKSTTPPSTDPAEPAAEKPVVPATGKSILIVEDERPLAHALEMKLKNSGYTVKVCMNGSDAISELEHGKYSLVLLDLIMPMMDGFGVLTEMQQRKYTVPTIVLSNLGQDEDRAKAKALGAIDYFVKSNTPISTILERVKSAL